MIQKDTLQFIQDLKENNDTDWFKANQKRYKNSRADFTDFVSEIIAGLSEIDVNIDKQDLQPKKCIKRINRDIRFSKDKSPYKTNYFAIFNPGGHKSEHASYYLHLEPGNSFIGGGVYMPPTPTLNKFRTEIEKNLEEWKSLLNRPSFKSTFPEGIKAPSSLKTAPKGFDKKSKAIEYLRMKGFYTMKNLSDRKLTQNDSVSELIGDYKEVKPIIDFLNEAL